MQSPSCTQKRLPTTYDGDRALHLPAQPINRQCLIFLSRPKNNGAERPISARPQRASSDVNSTSLLTEGNLTSYVAPSQ